MRLFKPNIDKLVGRRDVRGLLDAVRSGLKDEDFDLAKRALFGLSDLHDPRAVQPLIDIALGFARGVPYEAAALPLFSTITQSGGTAAIRPMLEAWSEFRGLNGRYRGDVLKGHQEREIEQDVMFALGIFSEAELLQAVYGASSLAEHKKRATRGEEPGVVYLQRPADLALVEILGVLGGAETLRFLEQGPSFAVGWGARRSWDYAEPDPYELARLRIKERLATKKAGGRSSAKK